MVRIRPGEPIVFDISSFFVFRQSLPTSVPHYVILTSSTPAIVAAKQVTSVIPIVFAIAADPIGVPVVRLTMRGEQNAVRPDTLIPSPQPSTKPGQVQIDGGAHRVRIGREATLAPNGSSPITRTTFPTCRAHYPGGSSGCACRLLPRITRPSPNGRRVGIRIVTFEACSGFTHVTARRIAQPPIGDLCHEAPTHAVTRTSRSSATGSTINRY
jgi:hypothetical protein